MFGAGRWTRLQRESTQKSHSKQVDQPTLEMGFPGPIQVFGSGVCLSQELHRKMLQTFFL